MESFYLSVFLLISSLTVDTSKIDRHMADVTGPFPSEKACEIYFNGSFTKAELDGQIKSLKFWESKGVFMADFEIVKGPGAGEKTLAAGKCDELRKP